MKIKSLDIYILRMWNAHCSDLCEHITAHCLMVLFARKPSFATLHAYNKGGDQHNAFVQSDQHLLCLLFETCNLISTFCLLFETCCIHMVNILAGLSRLAG